MCNFVNPIFLVMLFVRFSQINSMIFIKSCSKLMLIVDAFSIGFQLTDALVLGYPRNSDATKVRSNNVHLGAGGSLEDFQMKVRD